MTNFIDWRVVGRRLLTDSPQTIVDIDREDTSKSEQSKRDKMFEKWKEIKGSHATYKALMAVFMELKNHQAAEIMKKLVAQGRCCNYIIVLLFGWSR